MTGSGKTGLCIDLLEEAAIDGVPAILIDPKGDLGNLLLTFPDLRARRLRSPGSTRAQRPARASTSMPSPPRRPTRWKEGLAALGPGRRAHPPPAGRGRLRDLHAGQRRRPAAVGARLARAAGRPRRRRGPARRHRLHRDRPARAGRHRGRSRAEPRAHPAGHDPAGRLDEGREPRPAGADRAHPGSRDDARRRPRPGVVLPRQGPLRARDGRQQPARGARLRPLAARRADRRPGAPLRRGRPSAHLHRLHRPPLRLGADVRRHAAPAGGRGLGAPPVGHHQPARDPVPRRGLRASHRRSPSRRRSDRC